MMCKSDQMHLDYCRQYHNGMCAFHSLKECPGTCNNCPLDIDRSSLPGFIPNPNPREELVPSTPTHFNFPI